MSGLILHDYWRSGAAWRVRIVLNLKGVPYDSISHDLRLDAQRAAAYRAINPQALVPSLEVDKTVLTQSLAILEWLEETYPEPPLLPAEPLARAQVRAMCGLIACDIHPLQNLRVQQWLAAAGVDRKAWNARWISEGLGALEVQVQKFGSGCCYGAVPTLADCLLLPQLYSARRFDVPLDAYPALLAVEAVLSTLPPIAAAHPDRHPAADY